MPCRAGVKLAQGKRVVTEKDFIVDDSDVEYETASSAGSEDSGDSGPRGDGVNANLEDSWMGWAAGEAADQKLRDVLHSTGVVASSAPGGLTQHRGQSSRGQSGCLHRILVCNSLCSEPHDGIPTIYCRETAVNAMDTAGSLPLLGTRVLEQQNVRKGIAYRQHVVLQIPVCGRARQGAACHGPQDPDLQPVSRDAGHAGLGPGPAAVAVPAH